jgi:hypothetical protein
LIPACSPTKMQQVLFLFCSFGVVKINLKEKETTEIFDYVFSWALSQIAGVTIEIHPQFQADEQRANGGLSESKNTPAYQKLKNIET